MIHLRRCAASHRKESPFAGDAFEVCRAAGVECESRAGDEILDGAGDEDFSRLCLLGDSGADVNGDAADFPVDEFAFARVEAGADLKSETADEVGDRGRAVDSSRRAIETCKESVSGHVEFGTAKADEFPADQRVVLFEKLAPAFGYGQAHCPGGSHRARRAHTGGVE